MSILNTFVALLLFMSLVKTNAQILCNDGQEPHGVCTAKGKCPENEPMGWRCVKLRKHRGLYCCSTINNGSVGDGLPSYDELKKGHKKHIGSASTSEGSDSDDSETSGTNGGDMDQSDNMDESSSGDNSSSEEESGNDSSEDLSSESAEKRVPWCPDKILECAFHANLCIIERAFPRMLEKCPRTCNRCAGEIIDVADHCEDINIMKCRNPADIQLLSWQCPSRCGWTLMNRPTPIRTFNSPANALFQETFNHYDPDNNLAGCSGLVDDPSCVEWNKNSFCSSPYYNSTHKKQYCPILCKLCGVNV